MSATQRLILKDDSNGLSSTGLLSPIDSPTMMRKVSDHFGRASQGAMASNLALAINPVYATATVTFTGAGTANDTITIGQVTITLVASGASGNQINIGADATHTAAALVAFVNAGGNSGNLTGICTAGNVAGVVTLTAGIPGTIGNGLALSKSSTSITLTNNWNGGTEGTATVFSLGK